VDITSALRVIRGRWPETVQNNEQQAAPIFLFAAGWGSGSTLLQRLIMSDESIMLWGEPHDHAVPIARMAQMIAPVNDRWPRSSYFEPLDSEQPLQHQWIANLSPPILSLQIAHQAFFESWLGDSASKCGRLRWGLKDVRSTADHARYLRWLFPRSKFVFLVRDVLKSYQSCRHVDWLSVWPDFSVNRTSSFAHHWTHLAMSFLEAQTELDASLIRYEDLIAGQVDLDELARHLEVTSFDPAVLDLKLGSRSTRHGKLTMREEAIVRAIADPIRERMGYA
jgi:hypothetical protein